MTADGGEPATTREPREVSRFEADLLRVVRFFFGRVPAEQALPIIGTRRERPRCLGRVAVELAQRLRFDVVISDVAMPDMSGVELLEALRELDPDLPVVLTSGWPEASASLEAFAYLEKPVPFEMVCATAERAIALRRARSAARERFDSCASVERLRIPTSDEDGESD